MKMENKNGDNGNQFSSPVVKLSECLPELVKFTLTSHSHLLNFETGFCSTLLKQDSASSSPSSDFESSLEGVPPYPLHNRLASALLRCMVSQSFSSTSCNLEMMNNEFENSSMQQKHNEWQKLILDKGSEIVNVLKSVSFELHVQEPFFTQLKDGLKTIEGRCATAKYNRIELGNLILLNKSLVFEVQGVRRYPSFFDMLETEDLGKVLPGVENVKEGVKIYRRFYTEEMEQANGVLAISVSKLSVQPCTSLASLLSEKSLTHGARALAKHACRSSSGYWGSLVGNDSNKNRLAMDVINNLIAHCCWMNIHIVPPHGAVFEIRVADGYGARWNEDGSKFIGFLEPYMQDGHSKGWKH
ncbi:uncharacterized protein LOC131621758 isoform X2 [Vicia villosa]|uniref:uncharacterized protein LOC131621758 isoform X2 n=1 Tax=Vicia villosa TaxID=3911 RepID=UPI00273A75B5|nr:uncharacterized protein LOC131621758 isoform X2 [Vicia villosa]